TDVILSESINDSLMLCAIAAALLAVSARTKATRRASLVGLVMFAIAWLFTRDTNAFSLLGSLAVALVIWFRPLRASRLTQVLGLAALAAVALVIWSGTVEPSQPTHMSQSVGADPSITSRTAGPMIHNLFNRVLPDPQGRLYFTEHGFPFDPNVMV